MAQRKHQTVALCHLCQDNLLSIFVNKGTSGLEKVNGLAYCRSCDKVFKLTMEEV